MEFKNMEPVRFAWDQLRNVVPEDALEQVRLHENTALKEQSYTLHFENHQLLVGASDAAGMMYALLDLRDRYDGGWSGISDVTLEPRILRRGLKLNLPLDARTPSYSDASDSAFENIPQVWEWDFWTQYLDSMARSKYNVLSLWNLSPFPSLVRIREYPAIALENVVRSTVPPRPEMSGENMWTEDMLGGCCVVKKITMDEKIAFWRRVMEYAQDRCIRVYLFTWNLFVYGTEGNPYGITCDQRNPVTADYLYCATKALLETYPLLAGIGITSGENMAGDETDIPFLRATYGAAVEQVHRQHPERSVELIHRMQYARYPQIRQQYADFQACFSVSFKYSQAHIHSSPEPTFFSDFLGNSPPNEQFWLTLRDDDYYFYRWYDYGFARELLQKMDVRRVRGFYLGADGFTWGRDYTGYGEEHSLYLEKHWAKTALFGRLAYNPEEPESCFIRLMTRRLGLEDGPRFAAIWTKASTAFRTLQVVHWNDYDFQWYPEGCCRFLHPPVAKLVFSDINEFLNCPAMPGTAYLSVKDYCERTDRGEEIASHTPIEAVQMLREIGSERIPFTPQANWELSATLADIHALQLLSTYYADKLEAAVELCFYRRNRSRTDCQQRAVALLERAAKTWMEYSASSSAYYRPQRLTRMGGNRVDFRAFDRFAQLDVELAMLQ